MKTSHALPSDNYLVKCIQLFEMGKRISWAAPAAQHGLSHGIRLSRHPWVVPEHEIILSGSFPISDRAWAGQWRAAVNNAGKCIPALLSFNVAQSGPGFENKPGLTNIGKLLCQSKHALIEALQSLTWVSQRATHCQPRGCGPMTTSGGRRRLWPTRPHTRWLKICQRETIKIVSTRENNRRPVSGKNSMMSIFHGNLETDWKILSLWVVRSNSEKDGNNFRIELDPGVR